MCEAPGVDNQFLQQHVDRLLDSYQRLLGRPLVTGLTTSEQLFHAPFALLSHNADADPIFNYANQSALQLFELDWSQLCALPSRLSAEPVNQSERARLLELVTHQGYIDHYSGIRISRTGRRFWIRNAVVWNVYDADLHYVGQAAHFDDWQWL